MLMSYDVKDPKLSEAGGLRVEYAGQHMPVLHQLGERFARAAATRRSAASMAARVNFQEMETAKDKIDIFEEYLSDFFNNLNNAGVGTASDNDQSFGCVQHEELFDIVAES